MSNNQTTDVLPPNGGAAVSRYQIATTVGACSNFLGVLALFSHFGGQISKGSAPLESLIGGAAAIVLGSVLCLLGDIGKRLVCLEQKTPTDPDKSPELHTL